MSAPKRRKPLTLADCQCDGTAICDHCDRKLPKRTRVEVNGTYVVAHCPHCRCMTPFERMEGQ